MGDGACPSADSVGVALGAGAVTPLQLTQAYAVFASADEAHVGQLGQLAMPALFATAEFDANSSPAMAQAMAVLRALPAWPMTTRSGAPNCRI